MQLNNGLVISDSLFNLIDQRQGDSNCLKMLFRAILRVQRKSVNSRHGTYRSAKTHILARKLPGNYFTYREKEGLISYMPKGRPQAVSPDGSWRREGRQSMKPARWMKSMLNPRLAARIKDDEFALVTDIVRHEELRLKLTFAEVSADQGYLQKNFGPVKSCMWGREVGPFYDACGATVLVTKNGQGKRWKGRAVVWRNIEVTLPDGTKKEGVTFMDRIYSDTAETTMAFCEHAANSGWWRREVQGPNPCPLILPDGSKVPAETKLTLTLKEDTKSVPQYPYLDTLYYGDDKSLFNHEDGYRRYTYRQTNGLRGDGLIEEVRMQDPWGQYFHPSHMIEVDDEGTKVSRNSNMLVLDSFSNKRILRAKAFWINDGADGFYIGRQYVIDASVRLKQELTESDMEDASAALEGFGIDLAPDALPLEVRTIPVFPIRRRLPRG